MKYGDLDMQIMEIQSQISELDYKKKMMENEKKKMDLMMKQEMAAPTQTSSEMGDRRMSDMEMQMMMQGQGGY